MDEEGISNGLHVIVTDSTLLREIPIHNTISGTGRSEGRGISARQADGAAVQLGGGGVLGEAGQDVARGKGGEEQAHGRRCCRLEGASRGEIKG